MEYYSIKFLIWAVALGALSAMSLPLGSVIGLRTNLKSNYISVMAAFGAGALIAALSIELVAPTVSALQSSGISSHGGNAYGNFFSLLIGLISGGIIYFLLDQLVNANGGFLRKKATTIAYFRMAEKKRQKKVIGDLSIFPLIQNLESQHIETLVSMARPVVFTKGESIGRQGEMGKEMLFIIKGIITGILDKKVVDEFGPGSVTGLISLVANVPHPGTVTAKEVVNAYSISKSDFNKLREISTFFDTACKQLTSEKIKMVEKHIVSRQQRASNWAHEATQALRVGHPIPQNYKMQEALEEHQGAPLAIWLGILIDGIPESFVIGSGVLILLQAKSSELATLGFGDIIPFTLIAGLFLSNFPEALSSSATMKLQGWGKKKVFIMWFSLMVITGIGSGLGFLLAESLDPAWLIFAEGLAAGAMLTMIASAMIPEAVHIGNANLVGLSTLAGFIAAISFKLLE